MKKLKLNLSPNLGEVLTRNELKHVFGGFGIGSGDESDGPCSATATCPDGKTTVSCKGQNDCGLEMYMQPGSTQQIVVGVYCKQGSYYAITRCPGY